MRRNRARSTTLSQVEMNPMELSIKTTEKSAEATVHLSEDATELANEEPAMRSAAAPDSIPTAIFHWEHDCYPLAGWGRLCQKRGNGFTHRAAYRGGTSGRETVPSDPAAGHRFWMLQVCNDCLILQSDTVTIVHFYLGQRSGLEV
ncbi:hypothetical protein EYF80_011355 [Liparis tanakae]|uniref:Uncharacterized protein n=1 Tax=Liparis tanakae TaxID=230148 RepID=A0A4Z2IKR7_9TELE|nr:hypothetical protein EYF80_011355 [Liparis tanakae]